MRLSRCSGTPNIGVYARASDGLAIVSAAADPAFVRDVEEALGVEAVLATVSGTFLTGPLAAINSSGAVVSGAIESAELEALRKRVPVTVISDRLNAAGNNIAANDRRALVNPALGRKAEKEIEDALGVEVVRASVAGYGTVGSVCAVTNKGCVCAASASDEDLRLLREVFGFDAKRVSVNHGSAQVGAGLVCNSRGALVGDDTTPIEMGKIEDGLALF
ncbi:MAG: translation initiation factor IF-6 [Candidatus Methanoplasma sp.]|jgi:translation initiation factor 6|nr:translation initiation factor IF-6 [Candidatus Methanoplasma sp.]